MGKKTITVLSDSYYYCKGCRKRLGLFGLIVCGIKGHRIISKYAEEEIEIE